jgi:hypothetical protein
MRWQTRHVRLFSVSGLENIFYDPTVKPIGPLPASH